MSMNPIIHPDFLLETETARRLYHGFAAELPIIDYHCHLNPEQIASNHRFRSITEAWLDGDHYKWRAMRTHGVDEAYCTGNASDQEKFDKWAETVPYTLRNPLYHWTHMELHRPFGIESLLSPSTAGEIYESANDFLAGHDGSVQSILTGMKAEFIGTTDDPCDDLQWHSAHQKSGSAIKMRPTFRPDPLLNTADPTALNQYLDRLAGVTGFAIEHYVDVLNALQQRVDFFDSMGCLMSDHGLSMIPWLDFTHEEVNSIFYKIRLQLPLTLKESRKYQSALLYQLGQMYAEKGWVMQLHLGALRNNNSRRLQELGKDTGWDSIGDYPQAEGLSAFLDRLNQDNKLPKTILYNLNPADNHVFASMAGNFNEGDVPGKVQWGSAWWFLDQKDGMEDQLNVLSNLGLLPHFIGMLTDSRSFLSFPRHDYFRRILCNLFGSDVAKGILPNDEAWLGEIVTRICYQNVKNYLSLE